MFKPSLFLIICLVIFGCAAPQKGFSNQNDGVSMNQDELITKEKAKVIAQNAIREKGLDKDWNILKPRIKYEDDNEIGILFASKHPFATDLKYALPYLVVVNKKDGKIVAFGQTK